jgi:hypothetical protein
MRPAPQCAAARILLLSCAAAALVAVEADAVHGQRRQLSLEANPVHGTLGYGWARASGGMMGVELGFGFPQLDRTLEPASDDGAFADIMHIGMYLRSRPTARWEIDGRAQVGFAEYNNCSGCLPGRFGGASTALFWGGRHVKVGSRLKVGVLRERDVSHFVVSLTPIAVKLNYAW